MRGIKLSLQRHIENSRENIHGPCVIFYEGVPTNGRATLDPDYEALQISINRPRFIFNLDYESTGVPVPNPARLEVLHLFLLMCSPMASIDVFSSQLQLDSSPYSLMKSFEEKVEGVFGKVLLRRGGLKRD